MEKYHHKLLAEIHSCRNFKRIYQKISPTDSLALGKPAGIPPGILQGSSFEILPNIPATSEIFSRISLGMYFGIHPIISNGIPSKISPGILAEILQAFSGNIPKYCPREFV